MNLLTKMAQGLIGQKLRMVSAVDVRRVTGYQDFVDGAKRLPLLRQRRSGQRHPGLAGPHRPDLHFRPDLTGSRGHG